jgi:hypothetical protein
VAQRLSDQVALLVHSLSQANPSVVMAGRQALLPYVTLNTASASHFLKLSLSLNCLNSWLSSRIIEIMTRPKALSSSIRALAGSSFRWAFW